MIIRNVEEKDLDECFELLKEDELKSADGSYFHREWFYDYLDFFFVAEENGKIVGLIFGERLKSYGIMIWMFAVKKELRRQGIGKLLMKKFEDTCKEQAITWTILYSATTESTIKFYEKHGFDIGHKYIECKKELK